jgi:hypothetical protein
LSGRGRTAKALLDDDLLGHDACSQHTPSMRLKPANSAWKAVAGLTRGRSR